MTRLETIIREVEARLKVGLDADVKRGVSIPSRIGNSGLVIIRDGDPGDPDVTLSPLTYHFDHALELEIFADGASDRFTRFDVIKEQISTVFAADRALGGLCDWIEAEAPRQEDLPVEGGATIKAAIIDVVVQYATADSVG
ncbi:acyl-CoA transferase [Aestuariibius insulae]|uniref:acyl-CoA transferase n=1 Tax=Aestuariibius insulae TaxID=2058287 RepID=UPI00345EE2F7